MGRLLGSLTIAWVACSFLYGCGGKSEQVGTQSSYGGLSLAGGGHVATGGNGGSSGGTQGIGGKVATGGVNYAIGGTINVTGGAPASGGAPSTGGVHGSGGTVNTPCASLTQEACTATYQTNGRCRPAYGWNTSDFSGNGVYVGCGAGISCTDAQTCAFLPGNSGLCLRFHDGCFPDDWQGDPSCTAPGCPWNTTYGSGGASGGGGTQNSGGSVATGGSNNGSGGTQNSGGSIATGGSINYGGSANTGGVAGQAGSVGTGCARSTLESIQSLNGHDLCVAKLVTVGTGDKIFGIDATEVTCGQYGDWVATAPALPLPTDADCGWNTSYDISSGACLAVSSTPATDHLPVSVDWCDAYAYCAAIGKRLCGRIGGGPNPDGFADASKSQWFAACSSGGVYTYPYGNTYAPSSCNTIDYRLATPSSLPELLPVASLASCQSSLATYAGVYDLSGNVAEWEDNCSFGTGRDADCHPRGGNAWGGDTQGNPAAHCSVDHSLPFPRFTQNGLRCCSL